MQPTSDPTYTDLVTAELHKLGRSLLDLNLEPDRINFILHDCFRDGAPAFVTALSLVEASDL